VLIQLIVPKSAKCFYSKMVKHCALTIELGKGQEGGERGTRTNESREGYEGSRGYSDNSTE
jgi:hypothetical protein